MGLGLTRQQLIQKLSDDLRNYRDQEARGGDMAEAGRELACALDRLIEGPICGPSRTQLLKHVREELTYLRAQVIQWESNPNPNSQRYIEGLEKQIKKSEREERRYIREIRDSL